ncbi:MAG TPA: phosphatase PAP2 family protein [Pararhizobium sp.]|uniref:phosphatase PAP2 family protein n=1 Tax=Pararhizobium sp. TaxID=1977563 RepID=UPI002B52607F|nr:phosphatase PAP2 family protein [Pararhizobium sp.]HTO31987.1 phosphatase PAP2 family protein [Pararhizobium sp.]
MVFLPVERFILALIATLFVLDAGLIALGGAAVDIGGYAALVSCGIFCLAIGQVYRTLRNEARIAAPVTAAGLFILLSIAGSVFNYLLLPVRFTPIDDFLLRSDAALGFDWPSFAAWMSHYPAIVSVLGSVYQTSLIQMIAVILLLGFSGKLLLLHRFLLTGILGALLAIVFWFFFPSFGTSYIYDVSTITGPGAALIVDSGYGQELKHLAAHGVTALTPEKVLGLIAFPSVHTLMACMSVFFLRWSRVYFPVAACLNLMMLPAIILHGGHHLSDVVGGLALFCVAYSLAIRQTSANVKEPVYSPAA